MNGSKMILRSPRIFRVFLGVALAATLLSSPVPAVQQVEIVNSTINFGRVTQSKIITSSFFVKSTGNEPVKVTMLWSGCGCTEVALTDSIIAPGDSLRIPIRFSTGRMQGPVVKKPEIQTSASKSDLIFISLMAEVMMKPEDGDPVVMLPDVVDVSQFSEKVRRIDKFTLQNKSNEDLRVILADSALRSFEIKVDSVIPAGQTIEGKLRVKDDKIATDFEESVTFMFKGKDEYFYTLPVYRRYRPSGVDDK